MRFVTRQMRQQFAAVGFCILIFVAWVSGLFDKAISTLLLAGTSPAFASTPFSIATPGSLTAANTALDGTGTTLLILTAPSGGAFCERVHVEHLGTNVATVARVFRNNGSTPTVAGNNALIATKTIAANTLSQTAEAIGYDIVVNAALKSGERIYVAIGTAVAAGLMFTPYGGDL